MGKVKDKYVPVCEEMHDFLMDLYGKIMLTKDIRVSIVWNERFKGALEGWRTLKKSGMLTAFLLKEFHRDITNVMKEVHEKLDEKEISLSKLAEHQSYASLNMANLQSEFGGR